MTYLSQIFIETSTKGDPKSDIIARGIVSEELARVLYERYLICHQMCRAEITSIQQVHWGKQKLPATFRPNP